MDRERRRLTRPYGAAVATAFERMGGVHRTQAFYRLFMVPGMMHCQGGPGANAFGQASVAPGLYDDPRHDVRRALEAWVERGAAPRSIVAVKYVNDDPAKGVAMTTPLCAYPGLAESRGKGYVCIDATTRDQVE